MLYFCVICMGLVNCVLSCFKCSVSFTATIFKTSSFLSDFVNSSFVVYICMLFEKELMLSKMIFLVFLGKLIIFLFIVILMLCFNSANECFMKSRASKTAYRSLLVSAWMNSYV